VWGVRCACGRGAAGRSAIPHPQQEPLRPLSAAERTTLERLAHARHEGFDRVARAVIILAVVDGARSTVAARAAGRRLPRAVAQVVARFNARGLASLDASHVRGPPPVDGPAAYERILAEFRRPPDREPDGTATWSLTLLQRALRRAPDDLPGVSPWTIGQALHAAGYTWPESRTWCATGSVRRKRKAGVVTVTDPVAAEKRWISNGRT
jgi:hypothetical protein